jgi:predicted  nucleic acid-binding Zn-ribbon protein
LYRLRKFKQDHTDCEKKIVELEKSYKVLKGQADSYLLKLTNSEAKVRELELQISKIK